MRVNDKSADGNQPRSASWSESSAVAGLIQQMREEEERLRSEIARLSAELAAVARARVALERGSVRAAAPASSSTVSVAGRLRAPKGYLPKRILDVLRASEGALSRGQIIERLRESGYEFTLAPAAITRELIALVRARKLKREGMDNAARYVAVSRGRK